MWYDHLKLFEWMKRHKQRPLSDPRNLYCRCKVLSRSYPSYPIQQPSEYTLSEIDAHIVTIKEQLDLLAQIAPELRTQHLQKKKAAAEQAGMTRKAKRIATMLHKEHQRGRFSNMKATTSKKKGGGAVFAVERKAEDGSIELFATKEDIEQVAGQTIGERYKLAYSAPIMSHNKLLSDIGFTGDGEAVTTILAGTYKFPPGTDLGPVSCSLKQPCSSPPSERTALKTGYTVKTFKSGGRQHARLQSHPSRGFTLDTTRLEQVTISSPNYMPPV